jgi:hypothetical protein
MLGIVLGSATAGTGLYALLRWRFKTEATTYGSASTLSLFSAMQNNLF